MARLAQIGDLRKATILGNKEEKRFIAKKLGEDGAFLMRLKE